MGMDCYSRLFIGALIDHSELYTGVKIEHGCVRCLAPGVAGKFCQECGGKISDKKINILSPAIIEWTKKELGITNASATDEDIEEAFRENFLICVDSVTGGDWEVNSIAVGMKVLSTQSHRDNNIGTSSEPVDALVDMKSSVLRMLDGCGIRRTSDAINVYLQTYISV
jgi:hypothetical protein